jgi:hypothetical protein
MVLNELGGRRPTGLFGQPSLKPTAYKDALTPEPKGLRELFGHEFGGRIDADTNATTGLGKADGRRLDGYAITGFGHRRPPPIARASKRSLSEMVVWGSLPKQKCKTRRRKAPRVALFDITQTHYHSMGLPSITKYSECQRKISKILTQAFFRALGHAFIAKTKC